MATPGVVLPPGFSGGNEILYALSCFRRRKFDTCISVCDIMLRKNAFDQAVWSLKTQALTEQNWVDEIEVEEDNLADIILDDASIAQVARPGTSLKKPGTGINKAIRPVSQSGRPVTGFSRPGTQGGRPGTMEQGLRTARTLYTARPVTSASGRFIRQGTASMLSNDEQFINVSHLNMAKYGALPHLAKPLFEYIFHHENDVRNAMELASQATQAAKFEDWWWKVAMGKCYFRLGLWREAEQQFKSAIQQQPIIDSYLYLAKVYKKLDQPLASVDVYNEGLKKFPDDVSLLTGIARIYEELCDLPESVENYKRVLAHNSMSVEAIASIATNFFYSDQPELALRLFRRLLQMGLGTAEIFNNLGLCCFSSQQYDMAIGCFERALALANDETLPDIWYNISQVALMVGDNNLANNCLRISLAANQDFAEAYNNLGVIEYKKGHLEQARSLFQASASLGSHLYEPHFNFGAVCGQLGDFQASHNSLQKAMEIFPDHVETKRLMEQLRGVFNVT